MKRAIPASAPWPARPPMAWSTPLGRRFALAAIGACALLAAAKPTGAVPPSLATEGQPWVLSGPGRGSSVASPTTDFRLSLTSASIGLCVTSPLRSPNGSASRAGIAWMFPRSPGFRVDTLGQWAGWRGWEFNGYPLATFASPTAATLPIGSCGWTADSLGRHHPAWWYAYYDTSRTLLRWYKQEVRLPYNAEGEARGGVSDRAFPLDTLPERWTYCVGWLDPSGSGVYHKAGIFSLLASCRQPPRPDSACDPNLVPAMTFRDFCMPCRSSAEAIVGRMGAGSFGYPDTTMVVGWAALPDAAYTRQWGTTGAGNGQFAAVGPGGIASDASGNVYVADPGNNRIEKFTSSGAFVTAWGSAGSGNGQFNAPVGLAVDASGNVYVADSGNKRIQKFTSSGAFLTKWGTPGTGNGQFTEPYAVNASGVPATYVYVADRAANRVQKFTTAGAFVASWGTTGSGNGQFNAPSGIMVYGNVFVADKGNHRIQEFASNGSYISQWGSAGSGNGQFTAPVGLVTDQQSIYVVDSAANRIQIFDLDSHAYVAQWGTAGSGNGQFSGPLALAFGSGLGNLYVSDAGNVRVQQFLVGSGRPLPVFWWWGMSGNAFATPLPLPLPGGFDRGQALAINSYSATNDSLRVAGWVSSGVNDTTAVLWETTDGGDSWMTTTLTPVPGSSQCVAEAASDATALGIGRVCAGTSYSTAAAPGSAGWFVDANGTAGVDIGGDAACLPAGWQALAVAGSALTDSTLDFVIWGTIPHVPTGMDTVALLLSTRLPACTPPPSFSTPLDVSTDCADARNPALVVSPDGALVTAWDRSGRFVASSTAVGGAPYFVRQRFVSFNDRQPALVEVFGGSLVAATVSPESLSVYRSFNQALSFETRPARIGSSPYPAHPALATRPPIGSAALAHGHAGDGVQSVPRTVVLVWDADSTAILGATSPDGGETFGATRSVSPNDSPVRVRWRPAVAMSFSDSIYVVWNHARPPGPVEDWIEFSKAQSSSGGFIGPRVISDPARRARDPKILMGGSGGGAGVFDVIWIYAGTAGVTASDSVYLVHTANGGGTFQRVSAFAIPGSDGDATHDVSFARGPDGSIHVAVQASIGGVPRCFYSRLATGSTTFDTPVSFSGSTSPALSPVVSVDAQGVVGLVWSGILGGGRNIVFSRKIP